MLRLRLEKRCASSSSCLEHICVEKTWFQKTGTYMYYAYTQQVFGESPKEPKTRWNALDTNEVIS